MNIQELSKVSLSKEQAQDIRAIEIKVKDALSFDDNNTFDIGRKMLREKLTNAALIDCVASKYCIKMYNTFIYPMYFYLEYTNNYLTVTKIAEHYEIEENIANVFIETGKNVINSLIEQGC